jgi:4-amino-4-deoxy-L-arabinose transferase-like glycosyltransferase
MELSSRWYQRKGFKRILFIALLIIGILVRMIHLGSLPSGVDQDEAMAAYEAYTTATDGIDITGYHNPVYFEAWGNGMNALEIYLMIPFIQLLGLTDLAIRLPQAIIACAVLPVFYLLLKRLFDEKTAWIGLFLLVINPWHIMMSRWALESNLAPAFLLFGFYFFILALEKHPAYYLLSSLMYGLSLYTYAVIWIAVPMILFLQILYALFTKRARHLVHDGFCVHCGLVCNSVAAAHPREHAVYP